MGEHSPLGHIVPAPGLRDACAERGAVERKCPVEVRPFNGPERPPDTGRASRLISGGIHHTKAWRTVRSGATSPAALSARLLLPGRHWRPASALALPSRRPFAPLRTSRCGCPPRAVAACTRERSRCRPTSGRRRRRSTQHASHTGQVRHTRITRVPWSTSPKSTIKVTTHTGGTRACASPAAVSEMADGRSLLTASHADPFSGKRSSGPGQRTSAPPRCRLRRPRRGQVMSCRALRSRAPPLR